MIHHVGRWIAVAVLVAGCGVVGAQGAENAETRRFLGFLEEEWAYSMTEYPTWATWVGYPGQNHRWTDESFAAIERRETHERDALDTLRGIDRAKLPPNHRLDYDLYLARLELGLAGQRFPHELLAVSQLGGVQQDIARTVTMMPARTLADYENIVARLRGADTLIAQNLALLQEGLSPHPVQFHIQGAALARQREMGVQRGQSVRSPAELEVDPSEK